MVPAPRPVAMELDFLALPRHSLTFVLLPLAWAVILIFNPATLMLLQRLSRTPIWPLLTPIVIATATQVMAHAASATRSIMEVT